LKTLKQQFVIFILSEGGTKCTSNKVAKILTQEDAEFDYICCSIGTGGTISGIINSATAKSFRFPALKGDF
jgi:1-aminocyclopropane-1-carboxylate deaminase